MFIRDRKEAADFSAFEVEFHAVGFGVAEDGDEASGIVEEAINGPGSEGEGFAGLAAPEPDFDAVYFILKGVPLVWSKVNGAILDFRFTIFDRSNCDFGRGGGRRNTPGVGLGELAEG